MRSRLVLAVALCLALAMPATVLGAPPVLTTKISGASAFFTTIVGPCESEKAIITLGADAARSVAPDGPPSPNAWFDVQVWRETGCTDPAVGGYIQETISGLGPGSYRMVDLTAAFVVITFPIHQNGNAGGPVIRTLSFDAAWVADGSIAHSSSNNPGVRMVSGKSVGAHFTGRVVDSAGYISIGSLDGAGMGLGTYLIYK